MFHRVRRIPVPLAILLAVTAVHGCAWNFALPALQGPDELSHVSYVQEIAEQHTVPWTPRGPGPAGHPYSTEMGVAMNEAGFWSLTRNVAARAYYTSADEAAWRAGERRLSPADRKDGGFSSAFRNPPLYYMYDAIPYEIAQRGTFFDRSSAMRLGNIPLLLAVVVFVWLLAGELLPGPLWPRFLAAGTAALEPQMTSVSAGVNPDVMLAAEWSAALWLMALVCRRGARLGLVAPLVVVCAMSSLTHGRGLFVWVPAALAIALGVGRDRGWRILRARILVPALAVVYFGAMLAAAGRGPGDVREFVSYVWQFYLPKLSFMDPAIGLVTDYDFNDVYVERFYGTFASLDVVFSATVTRLFLWATVAGLVALVAALVVRWRAVKRHSDTAIVLLTAVISLVTGLHYVAYRAMLGNPGDPILTGRYLLPLIGLFGVGIAIVATTLPRRTGAAFTGLVLAVAVGLQWSSLGLMVQRFHA